MSQRALDVLAVLSLLAIAPWVVAALLTGTVLALVWSAGGAAFFVCARWLSRRTSPVDALQLAYAGCLSSTCFAASLALALTARSPLAIAAATPIVVLCFIGVLRPGFLLTRPALSSLVFSLASLELLGTGIVGVWLLPP